MVGSGSRASMASRKSPWIGESTSITTAHLSRGSIVRVPSKPKNSKPRFTVPEVWRRIAKLNERQGSLKFDVLVCGHVVVASDTAYRRFRACPDCRVQVQRFADEHDRRRSAA